VSGPRANVGTEPSLPKIGQKKAWHVLPEGPRSGIGKGGAIVRTTICDEDQLRHRGGMAERKSHLFSGYVSEAEGPASKKKKKKKKKFHRGEKGASLDTGWGQAPVRRRKGFEEKSVLSKSGR